MNISIEKGKPTGHVFIRLVEGKNTDIHHTEAGEELHIGIGKQKDIKKRGFFPLVRRIIVEAKQRGYTDIAVELKSLQFTQVRMAPRELVEAISYQFSIAHFVFDKYKTADEEKKKISQVVIIATPTPSLRGALERGQIVAREMNAARVLANTPGGLMTPEVLAKEALKATKDTKVKVTVLGQKEMKALKMGAVLGVANGSENPPRFIIMEYKGAPAKTKPIVLVGKGVTFDTGGVNLKPTAGLDDMHLDMSGGAIVMHAIVTAAKLKLKKNVIALIPAVENALSGASYRPGDILHSMSGKTIEIGNTDAEGRVIMADALTYAERYEPKLVVDVATLTGASLVALGQRASAIFSNRENLIPRVQSLGDAIGEYVWELPMWDEYDEDFKATFGDINNSHKIRYGGTILAARFLYAFAKKMPWIHIDMAPRMTSISGDYLAKGSTGEPMHLLVKVLERM